MLRGNPIALALICVGALMMVISAFLPAYQTGTAFSSIQDNSLIQQGGWPLVVAAVAIGASGFVAGHGKVSWSLPLGLSIIAALGLLRSVTPLGSNG